MSRKGLKVCIGSAVFWMAIYLKVIVIDIGRVSEYRLGQVILAGVVIQFLRSQQKTAVIIALVCVVHVIKHVQWTLLFCQDFYRTQDDKKGKAFKNN